LRNAIAAICNDAVTSLIHCRMRNTQDALTVSVGRQEEHPACRNVSVCVLLVIWL